jgi:hypothetical protein
MIATMGITIASVTAKETLKEIKTADLPILERSRTARSLK